MLSSPEAFFTTYDRASTIEAEFVKGQSARVCAIIVNYKGSADTLACVRSLQASNVPVDAVVVDSTPNDLDLLEALAAYPEARLIRAAQNVGFGRANNLGVQAVLLEPRYDYILLLNNDATVRPETLDILLEAFRRHPDVSIMVPRIVYMDNPSVLWYGGGDVDWRRSSAVAPGFGKAAEAGLALQERDVTFVSGCAILFQRAALETLQGFDPRYFMYEEDVELSLRSTKQGFRMRYIPTALVRHRAQGSTRSEGQARSDFWDPSSASLPFYSFHIIRNRLLTAYLHARGAQAIEVWIFFPLFILRRAIPFLIHGRFDAIAAMFRGALDFWRSRHGTILNSA
jgi:GT2 family glycosyltransferase